MSGVATMSAFLASLRPRGPTVRRAVGIAAEFANPRPQGSPAGKNEPTAYRTSTASRDRLPRLPLPLLLYINAGKYSRLHYYAQECTIMSGF
jgi:hypothetical protein